MGDTTEGQGSKLSITSISGDEKPVSMYCPVCSHSVVKVRETDVHIKHNVLCSNDFYQHYIDSHGDHKVIRFKNPPEQKFPEEKLNYAPFK
jgi:hypothetical protein